MTADNSTLPYQPEDTWKLTEYMRLVMENAPFVCILLNEEFEVLYCSDSLLYHIGVASFDEIKGMNLRDGFKKYFGRDMREWAQRNFSRLTNGEDIVSMDCELNWPVGSPRSYLLTERRLKDKEGVGDGIVIILQDVTDLRREEAERQRQFEVTSKLNAYMKMVMEFTPNVIFLLDREARVVYYSRTVLSLPGIGSAAQISRETLSDIFEKLQDSGFAEQGLERFRRLQYGEEYLLDNESLSFPNSGKRHFQIAYRRITDRNGEFDGVLLVMQDTTVLIEEEDEQRVRDLLRATPLVCMLWDENGNVLDCNQRTFFIFGYPEGLPAERYQEIVGLQPEYQPDGVKTEEIRKDMIRKTLSDGYWQLRIMLSKANGEPLPAEVTSVRVSLLNSRLLLVYVKDLTEIAARQAEAEEAEERAKAMELQKQAAQAATQAKSQFLASMSHEIRTPMNVITGLLNLMRTDNLDKQQIQYISDIQRMCGVLLEIINGILDFHKIETGKMELLPTHFNLRMLFDRAVSLNCFMAEAKSLEFLSEYDDSLPETVYGDEVRVYQIVSNLVTNAVKYTHEGFVRLRVKRVFENEMPYITFIVEDTGIGIEEKNFKTLFREFEQFDKLKNRGIIGTGLGLAISKRLAEMMNGQIRFSSEYGRGSVFTALLPLPNGNADKVSTPTITRLVLARPDTKVLVVDDNPLNLKVAAGMLNRHGIKAETATSGVEAVDKIKAARYDLIFMDHMMPEMDGIEATKIVRGMKGEYYRRLPIIALSANAVSSARMMYINGGLNDFVSKPIDGNELNRVLRKWLPPEKLSDKESPSESPADAGEHGLIEELSAISDIDTEIGIARVGGNANLYISVLRQFYNGIDRELRELQRMADEKKWKEYGIRMHALKTVFANIGNQSMSDRAYALEMAVKQDAAIRESDTGLFRAALERFQADLARTSIAKTDDRIKRTVSTDELIDLLNRMSEACAEFRGELAEELAGELSSVSFNERIDARLEEINAYIRTYDYNKAEELIKETVETLDI